MQPHWATSETLKNYTRKSQKPGSEKRNSTTLLVHFLGIFMCLAIGPEAWTTLLTSLCPDTENPTTTHKTRYKLTNYQICGVPTTCQSYSKYYWYTDMMASQTLVYYRS